MIRSVRSDGTTACMTVEGATTGEVFEAYVEHVLLPTLHPGDVVVLDNLSSHKNKRALELTEQAGVQVRFLPAYSPDLNPKCGARSKLSCARLKSEPSKPPDGHWRSLGSRHRQRRYRLVYFLWLQLYLKCSKIDLFLRHDDDLGN